MLSSSQIKDLEPKYFNRDLYHFHGKKKCNCFHGTSAKEDRIATQKIKEHRESFIVKIEKYGNVNHSPENPVWKIPGFCYLECINLALERGHFWPANPTVYTFANFGQKYRKPINFCLVETEPGKHFTVRTFPDGDSTLAWKRLEFLATTKKSFMCVGGNDDDSSGVKLLDGTTYHQWRPKMEALLKYKELWGYVSGDCVWPDASPRPTDPSPADGTSTLTAAQKKAHKDAMDVYVKANKDYMTWQKEDAKCLGLMLLKMIDKLQYLMGETTNDTWNNIKKQFDVSGPAVIFVDFRNVINFKFDERKDPSVQVTELNTRINRLATHKFALDDRIQAMIILSGLPQSWDSMQGATLANMPMNNLNINAIMPILQEEWQQHQARHHKHKSSHLARTNIRGGPQHQQWQGPSNYNQQAGQQNYNHNYNKPAPYNKFSKRPNNFNNFNGNQKPNYNKPSGSNGPLGSQ